MNTKTKRILTTLTAAIVFAAQTALAAALPEDVKGLAATPIDAQSIGLTWDAAKDATDGPVKSYRIYYGTTSVFKAGEGEYENELDTKNSNTSYVINNLKSETEYYFSITAIDSDDNESEQYAQEVSAKTHADKKKDDKKEEDKTDETKTEDKTEDADKEGPKVVSVSATDQQTIEVKFNEVINLKYDQLLNSFMIVEQQNSNEKLAITKVKLDEIEEKTVATLTTDTQKENTNYVVTVDESVTDTSGNKVEKGVADSGLFLGSTKKSESAEEKKCEDFACFAKKMETCEAESYTESDDQFTYKLDIMGQTDDKCNVKYTAEKHPNVLFAGSTMECGIKKAEYKTLEDFRDAFNLTNCTGDLVSGYKEIEIKDITPPEDVTNLMASFSKMLEKYAVTLKWTASLNTAKDLVDQVLYMSNDRGENYDAGKGLGAAATQTKVENLDGGKEYTFKITTKDDAGNESAGAIKSIRLPQTGLGAGLLLFGSAMAARQGLRRRRK